MRKKKKKRMGQYQRAYNWQSLNLYNHNKKGFLWFNRATNQSINGDFDLFVDQMSQVFEKINPTLNTNANKSLHVEVLRVDKKKTLWFKEGYEVRVPWHVMSNYVISF